MNQTDMAKTLDPVVQVFQDLAIRYYIGGSVASSTYGIARMTMDVDLVAQIEQAHVPTLVAKLRHIYYIDQNMIVDAINQQGSFNGLSLSPSKLTWTASLEAVGADPH